RHSHFSPIYSSCGMLGIGEVFLFCSFRRYREYVTSDNPESRTINKIESQKAGDCGFRMLLPIRVARIMPGKIPKVPASRCFQNGVFVAPKYSVTISQGRQLMTRRKKHRKNEFFCCLPISSSNRGYFSTSF